jgi:hypothetical protein
LLETKGRNAPNLCLLIVSQCNPLILIGWARIMGSCLS